MSKSPNSLHELGYNNYGYTGRKKKRRDDPSKLVTASPEVPLVECPDCFQPFFEDDPERPRKGRACKPCRRERRRG